MLRTTEELIQLLDGWRTKRIVVAGDFMLDHHIYGHAERLSPDAPVPVLAVEREVDQPGGSSNVCLDLRALKCDVTCLGVIGDDGPGRRLANALKKVGCDVAGLVVSPDRPTTVKQNFVGLAQHRHPQKMFRVDTELKAPIPAAVSKKLLKIAEKSLKGASALCIEDYNKGVLSPTFCQALIKLAKRMKVPVLIDPAAISDYSKYAGATCITPNRFEASLAAGVPASATQDESTLSAIAHKLLDSLTLDSVVLTLDKQGAMLLEKGGEPVLMPTLAREVYDVTGAGDMILAMMAAAIANGADTGAALQLGNTAAGLEVERFGVVPIELHEVLLSLLRQQHGDRGNKARTLDTLVRELSAHRKEGKKIVFTNGCFDILHAGHVSFLRAARREADILVLGLNSDASIKRLKGPERPVNHEADRLMVLSELQSVDYLVVFGEDTPIKLIRAIKPDVLVKGADYKKSQVVGASDVEKYGGKVVLVDLVEGRSTTNIIRKISANKR